MIPGRAILVLAVYSQTEEQKMELGVAVPVTSVVRYKMRTRGTPPPRVEYSWPVKNEFTPDNSRIGKNQRGMVTVTGQRVARLFKAGASLDVIAAVMVSEYHQELMGMCKPSFMVTIL